MKREGKYYCDECASCIHPDDEVLIIHEKVYCDECRDSMAIMGVIAYHLPSGFGMIDADYAETCELWEYDDSAIDPTEN